jgi:hypothetical protein
MKIAIMQPYFFPYLGYFSLIKHTERFIILDTVQFIKHGWIERNRILKPNSGFQYISIPLIKYSRETKINDVIINNNIDWRDKIFRQLEHYKKRAPFYGETIDIIKKSFDIETQSIVELNRNILKNICNYINIDLNIDIFSKMDLEIRIPNAPDEWALNICKSIGDIEEYWNPEGGIKFFNPAKYEKEGIKINFLKMDLPIYKQRRSEFVPGLSIIDVMMFNESSKINKMLDEYQLL